MAWCIYNSSGPMLLLWHRLFHNRLLTLWVNFWAISSSLIVLAIVVLIWIILPPEFDYSNVRTLLACRCCGQVLSLPEHGKHSLVLGLGLNSPRAAHTHPTCLFSTEQWGQFENKSAALKGHSVCSCWRSPSTSTRRSAVGTWATIM